MIFLISMFTIIEWLCLCLFVLRPFINISQSVFFNDFHWLSEFKVINSKWLIKIIDHEKCNNFSFQWLISCVFYSFYPMNVLIRENYHQIFFNIKGSKRNYLIRITQSLIVWAILMSTLFLLIRVIRDIIRSRGSFKF